MIFHRLNTLQFIGKTWGRQCISARRSMAVISLPEHELVKVSEEGGVRCITMKDDKTRNSLTLDMTSALIRNVTRGNDDPSLRCIVIASNGPVFSAGHNLKEIADGEGRKVFYCFNQLMLAMIQSPVPVVSVVDGHAAAAGCQLAAQSDIVIASKKAQFSTPGVKYGIFCHTPGIPLVRTVPTKLASYMLFTGKPINADEAYKAGLVSVLVSEGSLEDVVACVVKDILNKSRIVVELGKKFLYRQMEMGIKNAYEQGAEIMDSSLSLPDGIEGLRSFAEKRDPVWKHVPSV